MPYTWRGWVGMVWCYDIVRNCTTLLFFTETSTIVFHQVFFDRWVRRWRCIGRQHQTMCLQIAQHLLMLGGSFHHLNGTLTVTLLAVSSVLQIRSGETLPSSHDSSQAKWDACGQVQTVVLFINLYGEQARDFSI